MGRSDCAVSRVGADWVIDGLGSAASSKIMGTNHAWACLGFPTSLDRWDVEESTVTSASFPSIVQSLLLGGQSFEVAAARSMNEKDSRD